MRAGVGLVALVAACQSGDRPAPLSANHESPPAVRPDTMVLAVPGGQTIWLAEGRDARDSAGTACFERSVEIRTGGSRTKVPLLFVQTGPTMRDRDHLRAELSLHCRVMAIYSVELATGRPVKLEDR